jgi:phospholipid/cholesterol/gamma-HCH transport system permease protein
LFIMKTLPENQRIAIRAEYQDNGACVLILLGEWTRRTMRENNDWQTVFIGFPQNACRQTVKFDCTGLKAWDMRLVATLAKLIKACEVNGCKTDFSGLPDGIRGLFALSEAVPEAEGRGLIKCSENWLGHLGRRSLNLFQDCMDYTAFLGELIIGLFATIFGRGSMQAKDFWLMIQNTGPKAVPITSLLAFLTGLIIAYIGVLQLQKLAADIFVADLVGLVMTRELSALMTGIIMAGRTGASYAAQLGSMRVNEEIDALKSFGISPVRFLVVPKVMALVLMMPLLVAIANVVAIFGGMIVAVGISDVTIPQYHYQILNAVGMADIFVGLFKSLVFGFIIALSGCYRGLRSGRDAAAVGQATTSAVVMAITWIVIADAIFAVLLNILGI